MAKICPVIKEKVLYVDCLECKEKECKKAEIKKEEGTVLNDARPKKSS